MSREGLVSDNEVLDDVPTSALELLGAEYHLGRARLMLPTSAPDAAGGPGPSPLRRRNVSLAIGHYLSFLRRLERLGEGMLEDAALAECRRLLDAEGGEDEDDGECDGDGDRTASSSPPSRTDPSELREAKIRRYQRRKATEGRRLLLQSQLRRRSRLGLPDEEALDGHDAESLTRTAHVETLRLHAETSLEEVHSSRRELEMLDVAARMSTTCGGAAAAYGDPRMNGAAPGAARTRMAQSPSSTAGDGGPPDRRRPLQMTQITQNPATGQLELTAKRVASDGRLVPAQFARPTTINRRDEISSGVFRPGWNLPTMTLEELGERELAGAVRRAEEQRYAEAGAMLRPRRYDQLERDGMEDDDGLVEASANLDREWDDWKDENPRGCGNKMGDRGDRNF